MTPETRYMRNDLTETYAYVSGYNVITGSLAGGTILKLIDCDDDYMVFSSATVGSDEIVEVEFTGIHSGHLPFLQEKVELKASAAVSCEIAAYNYDTGTYETAGSMFLSFVLSSEVTKYLYSILNNRNYRSDVGAWKVKIKCTRDGGSPAAFTLSLDCVYYRTVAYELGTAQTVASAGAEQNVRGSTVGVRIWKVNSDDTEIEIGADGTHAPVTGPSSTTTLSATWTCPPESDVVAVVVRVYKGSDFLQTADPLLGGLPAVFITEDLDTSLLSAEWTIYYAFLYVGFFIRETYYKWGSATYNSRITNFSYGVPVVKAGLNIPEVLPLLIG